MKKTLNQNTINNISVINKDAILKTLEDTQSGTGYYSYENATLEKYNIAGKEQLVYVAPREMVSSGRTYNNKTYENTHGISNFSK